MDALNARRIAETAHRGQPDKNGAPYIEHVIRVAAAVPEYARVVAFLHDVVEDHSETHGMERLGQLGLTQEQAVSLVAITRQPHETYTAYLERVCADRIATEVKLRDLQDNLAPARLLQCSHATRERLLAKYLPALDRVCKALWYHTTKSALASVMPDPEGADRPI